MHGSIKKLYDFVPTKAIKHPIAAMTYAKGANINPKMKITLGQHLYFISEQRKQIPIKYPKARHKLSTIVYKITPKIKHQRNHKNMINPKVK